VELRGVAKVFPGEFVAIHPLDLTIEEGALFVIVGPSGSGKSTLLRLIAGLEPLSSGSLWIDGRRADGLPPRDRDLSMVFQTPVVYPHLSVFENLAFGLRARRVPRAEVSRGVAEAAAMLGLTGRLDRRPATLSGGERQRVALGRALARRPRLLLLDEPFSSLDAPLRLALRAALGDLHRRLGTTMIHVTHDQAEALALGTRVAVLEAGRIVQAGAPLDVYDRPASRFVGEFLGSPPMNVLPCRVEATASGLRLGVVGTPDDAGWTIPEAAAEARRLRQAGPIPGRVDLGIRAEHIRVLDGPTEGPFVTQARVRRVEPLGHETLVTLALGPHPLTLRLSPRAATAAGASVTVALDPARIVWFDPESGRALYNS
jgi:ABC-type sugar transport system ATPase subunit